MDIYYCTVTNILLSVYIRVGCDYHKVTTTTTPCHRDTASFGKMAIGDSKRLRKLIRTELKLLKEYDFGKVGKCCVCGRIGLTSCYFAYKDPKINRKFGLNGTHVMTGIGMYYPDGTRAQHPKEGTVEIPSVCKTCNKKHFDQRYDDGKGNNPHGNPITETGRGVSMVDKESWLKKSKEAEQRAIEYREKHKQEIQNTDWVTVLTQSFKPR